MKYVVALLGLGVVLTGNPFRIRQYNKPLKPLSLDFYFGTKKTIMALAIVLNSPEMVLVDALCWKKSCSKYCDVPQFCREFCDPRCCSANKKSRRQKCRHYLAYDRNSAKFQELPGRYWRSQENYGAGEWAEDELNIRLNAIGKPLVVYNFGVVDFVLETLPATTFNIEETMGSIGLGRHPKIKRFAGLLAERGVVNYTGVTIALPEVHYSKGYYYFTFGDYNTDFCEEQQVKVEAVGNTEWIFDVMNINFLGYSSHERFRMMLTESTGIRLPRHVLHDLIVSGIFVPAGLWDRNDFYILNQTMLINDGISFQINQNLRLDSDVNGIDATLPNQPIIVQAEPLDPNPDKLEWAFGRTIFYKYCVFLDYQKNEIGFSKVKEPE
ncbi:unnamed protein product [Bursaphelenchus xylophilus]|nr:unnamed protein product [Bursaphelenchus xylophilus]CAG9092588.1 unnamed protein product [Bursaphelenchus xylophilus]